jgi:hypothetical protein
MRIAIDYDGTYTADPGLWDAFIDDAKRRGHEVLCIAQREVDRQIFVTEAPPMLVHYIGSQRKTEYARGHQLKVDVWIDDNPHELK